MTTAVPKVVVLGAGGLLGRHCMRVFRNVVGYDRVACSITNYFRVRRAVEGAQLVLNCAAYTKADDAETSRGSEEAWLVNATGAGIVAKACRSVGATLVHVSTDSVFDGKKDGPYEVTDPCHPLSVYGRSKLAGEELVREVDGRVYIVRVQGLYGDGGRNFASSIIQRVRAGASMRLDCERATQPTWALAAALQIEKLAAAAPPGTYHVSCRGRTTWHGFAAHAAMMLAEMEGRQQPVKVSFSPVPTGELELPARRPHNCTFSHQALEDAGVMQMLDWKATLRAYLDPIAIAKSVP